MSKRERKTVKRVERALAHSVQRAGKSRRQRRDRKKLTMPKPDIALAESSQNAKAYLASIASPAEGGDVRIPDMAFYPTSTVQIKQRFNLNPVEIKDGSKVCGAIFFPKTKQGIATIDPDSLTADDLKWVVTDSVDQTQLESIALLYRVVSMGIYYDFGGIPQDQHIKLFFGRGIHGAGDGTGSPYQADLFDIALQSPETTLVNTENQPNVVQTWAPLSMVQRNIRDITTSQIVNCGDSWRRPEDPTVMDVTPFVIGVAPSTSSTEVYCTLVLNVEYIPLPWSLENGNAEVVAGDMAQVGEELIREINGPGKVANSSITQAMNGVVKGASKAVNWVAQAAKTTYNELKRPGPGKALISVLSGASRYLPKTFQFPLKVLATATGFLSGALKHPRIQKQHITSVLAGRPYDSLVVQHVALLVGAKIPPPSTWYQRPTVRTLSSLDSKSDTDDDAVIVEDIEDVPTRLRRTLTQCPTGQTPTRGGQKIELSSSLLGRLVEYASDSKEA